MYSPKAFDLSLNVQIFCISLFHILEAHIPVMAGPSTLTTEVNLCWLVIPLRPWQVARWA